MKVFNYLYYAKNKKRIELSKSKLKRITIDTVYEIITKNCWKYGIQYEVVVKNKELLDIRLQGSKTSKLIRFHKNNMVFIQDYNNFKSLMYVLEVKKGIYITTGVFEEKVFKANHNFFNDKSIKLEDNFDFIKKQIVMNPKHKNHIVYQYIDFQRYLPY